MARILLANMVNPSPCSPGQERANWEGIRRALERLDEILQISQNANNRAYTTDLENVRNVTITGTGTIPTLSSNVATINDLTSLVNTVTSMYDQDGRQVCFAEHYGCDGGGSDGGGGEPGSWGTGDCPSWNNSPSTLTFELITDQGTYSTTLTKNVGSSRWEGSISYSCSKGIGPVKNNTDDVYLACTAGVTEVGFSGCVYSTATTPAITISGTDPIDISGSIVGTCGADCVAPTFTFSITE